VEEFRTKAFDAILRDSCWIRRCEEDGKKFIDDHKKFLGLEEQLKSGLESKDTSSLILSRLERLLKELQGLESSLEISICKIIKRNFECPDFVSLKRNSESAVLKLENHLLKLKVQSLEIEAQEEKVP